MSLSDISPQVSEKGIPAFFSIACPTRLWYIPVRSSSHGSDALIAAVLFISPYNSSLLSVGAVSSEISPLFIYSAAFADRLKIHIPDNAPSVNCTSPDCLSITLPPEISVASAVTRRPLSDFTSSISVLTGARAGKSLVTE